MRAQCGRERPDTFYQSVTTRQETIFNIGISDDALYLSDFTGSERCVKRPPFSLITVCIQAPNSHILQNRAATIRTAAVVLLFDCMTLVQRV